MEHVDAGGARIPRIGFGTWQLRGEQCREGVAHALELGYRHIDTARLYGNEAEVGAAIRDSGLDRDEILLATKIPGRDGDRRGVEREMEASLRELALDHVDLLLLHQPGPHPIGETMEAFRAQQEAGRVRFLGVSNFDVSQLEAALAEAVIVNVQNRYHPGARSQADVLEWCRAQGVSFTAYSPLAKGREAHDRALAEIGDRHGKTAAQVALRWAIQQEPVVTVPRSATPEHRADNIDVFDFALSEEEMRRLSDG